MKELSGFLVVDKPKGISSFGVVRAARKALNIKKIGHLGTLDPLATGVLVLAVGSATKLIEYLMKADKSYTAEIMLGATSTTYDAEGDIMVGIEPNSPISPDIMLETVQSFKGKYVHTPPVYSALKVDGKRACDRVRAGENVNLRARTTKIFEIEINNYEYPQLDITVACSSGTYIRSLAHDIGQKLGIGGYIQNLRRLHVGTADIKDSVQVDDIEPAALRPLDYMVSDWPHWQMPAMVWERLYRGLTVAPPKKLLTEAQAQSSYTFPLIVGMVNDEVVGILEWKQGGNVLSCAKRIAVSG